MKRYALGRIGLAAWLVAAGVEAGGAMWPDKVDPWLLQAASRAADGQADFLVVLEEQADLSGAALLRDKAEKGHYVVGRLQETAWRAQAPLLKELHRAGVEAQPFWIVNMIRARGDLNLARKLADRADVRRIAGNPPVDGRLPSPDPAPRAPRAVEWGVTRVRAPEVWALGYTGQGVVIAGQDTGYAWTHPALKNTYRGFDGSLTNHHYHWHDAIHSGGGSCGTNSPVPCDDSQHGTHTMGTMVGDDGAGHQVGVAPGARWIGCRNMNQGWGTPVTYTECFQWFIAPTDLDGANPDPARAPDVINNSWGCPASEGCTDVNVLSGVVAAVRAAGIVVVASAGNYGSGCETVRDPPALYEDSFSVGNTDNNNNISGSSSRGPVTADYSGRMKPNVSAPGSSIQSSIPGGGYGTMSGTSMAGPHVAGVVALILDAHPGLRGEVARIEHLIEQTALPLRNTQICGGLSSTNVPNNTFGWGLVDAVEAVGLYDSDGDGLPNWWEIVFGRDRADPADAHLDPDGDGLTTWQEFIANTDPTNAASALKLLSLHPTDTGTLAVAWNSWQDGFDAPRPYTIYRTRSLTTGTWEAVAADLPAQGAITTWSGPDPLADAPWFYRVAVVRDTNEVRSAVLAWP